MERKAEKSPDWGPLGKMATDGLRAAVGSVAGEHIAEEIYGDRSEAFHRALRSTENDIRKGIAETDAWIRGRNARLRVGHGPGWARS